MSAEFGVEKKACFFCGQPETVGFNEHYTFCPDCSAIFTKMSIEKGCKHIHRSAVVVIRAPWYRSVRESAKPHVLETESGNVCSVCREEIIDSGW